MGKDQVKVYGNYGRLLRMDRNGDAYFYMTVTKSKLSVKDLGTAEEKGSCPDMEDISFFYCSGKVPEYHLGYPLILFGEWEKGVGGRWELLISDYEEDIKTGKALEDFLISECPGVGEATAGKLSKTGERLWELAEKEDGADILQKETGISSGLCFTVLSALKKNRGKYNLYQYLRCYGITDIKTDVLIEKYGVEALEKVKGNPYQSLHDFKVPFRIMDEIAFVEGVSHTDRERIKGLIFHAMDLLTKDGSTRADIFMLYQKIEDLSAKSIYHRKIPESLISVILKDIKWLYIAKNENQVYFREMWKKEWDIARGIKRMGKRSVPLHFIPEMTAEIEEELGITYAKKQKEAFEILKTTGVKVLTGGPGTGKTTLMNGIIRQYQKMYPEHRIALCAPTGMAAEHMAEMTGRPASTIHRLLDYRPFSDGEASFKTAEDPIGAEMIIVDEVSMSDTKLMGMLFDAVRSDTLLLLCGDADQLDCVGYGSVLHDIIQSGVPVYELDVLFRQKEGGNIIQNAARIRQKDPKLAAGDDFEVWRFDNKHKFAEIFENIWGKYGKDPFQTQVLSTVKNGSYGIRAINTYIQQQRVYEKGREIHRNGYVFHKGDKVMTTVNNYEAGYFNGDIGQITEITDMGNVTVQIGKKPIRMKHTWLEDMVPAYAVTVHKSQGSEFETVIIILPKKPGIMLDKSLIYTAVTRAKSKVIILSEGDALEYGIRRDKRQDRKTGLVQKIGTL